MCVGCVGERIDVFEAKLEGAVGHAIEDVFGAGFEVSGGGDIVLHGGASDAERAHRGEADEVEGWDGSAGSAEEDHEAARAEALEGLLEGRFSNRVVDDGKTAAVGELLDAGGEVFFGVDDDLIGTGCAGEGGFFLGRNGSDNTRTESFGHLDEEEAGTAGSSMDENFVAALDGVGRMSKVVRGNSLNERACGLLGGDTFGNGDETFGGSDSQLGIGARNAAPGDVIAGFKNGDIWRNGDNCTGGLLAEGIGKFRGVTALTEVGIDEVDAGGFDANESFAGARSRGGKITESEDVN